MKSLILISAAVILIFLEGCETSKIITQKNYDLSTEKTAAVGSTMLSYISAKSQTFQSNSSDSGTKDELVYTGKSGSTIRIDFIEYYIYEGDWYLEDGYPLHLEYDMASGNIITCKYYKMMILSSDNNEIKFIVISD